ncbi:MAG TPA: adenylate kinase [Thermoflexia bacterium]|nr:adenylate kinase [Thermoflexia bacterium]
MGCRVVLLGLPGAGKGTQAERLAASLGVPHVASGDLFREHLNKGTELGLQARAYIDRGDLVPDEITIGMVAERLARPDCADGFVLDGFPRTVAQAEALERVLDQMGTGLDIVPLIRVSEEVALARLAGRWTCRKCGVVYHTLFNPPKQPGVCDACGGELYQRSDETPEAHRRRLEVYKEQTAPLVDYYRQAGLLVEINGEQSIEDVQADLWSAVRSACGVG